MEIFKLSLFVLLLNSVAFAAGLGGDGVGNGGDGITQLFEDARVKAVSILERLDPCTIPKDTQRDVREWILENRHVMIADIQKSPHIWGDNNITRTCAWTGNDLHQYIIFSTQECRASIYDLEVAAALLVHESVHHFGIKSESFAKEVANAVRKSEFLRTCKYDPFNEESCQLESGGPAIANDPMKMTVTYAPIEIGNYRLYSRIRGCRDVRGCSAWDDYVTSERVFYDNNDDIVILPTSGKAQLLVNGPNNDMFIKTFGTGACRWFFPKPTLCDFGVGTVGRNTLYQKIGTGKQKLSFVSVYTGKCLRQYAKLIFREPNSKNWVEVQHVVFSPD